ncbi:MAG: hypothetical protein DRQ88_02140 [Epsilonproteobacteria bacterium]|nr:MAG: hypothetical protein DRQ89_00885 [Campylobacterota bacterium]RLA67662.1 MAG: hypothetical protein DRQ88_02140 [Campylobacterota bacterium]
MIKIISLISLLLSLNLHARENNLFKMVFEKLNWKSQGLEFSMKVTPNSGEMPSGGMVIVDDMRWMDDSIRGQRYVFEFKSGEYGEMAGYLSNIKELKLTETWYKCGRGKKTWIRKGEGLCP